MACRGFPLKATCKTPPPVGEQEVTWGGLWRSQFGDINTVTVLSSVCGRSYVLAIWELALGQCVLIFGFRVKFSDSVSLGYLYPRFKVSPVELTFHLA